jgi:hypothetical protein
MPWVLFLIIYRQQLFEQPHTAADCIMFLMKYLENLNLEILHWVVILNKTFVPANSSGEMALASLLGRGHSNNYRYIIVHAGT